MPVIGLIARGGMAVVRFIPNLIGRGGALIGRLAPAAVKGGAEVAEVAVAAGNASAAAGMVKAAAKIGAVAGGAATGWMGVSSLTSWLSSTKALLLGGGALVTGALIGKAISSSHSDKHVAANPLPVTQIDSGDRGNNSTKWQEYVASRQSNTTGISR